jgi:hypothetical protein
MLKRYQVLLPDWLENYIKYQTKLYDFSFSEIIRLQICLATLQAMEYYYPEYKSDLVLEELFTEESLNNPEKIERNDILKNVSKIYFETRKAIEFRMEKEKDRIKALLDEEETS